MTNLGTRNLNSFSNLKLICVNYAAENFKWILSRYAVVKSN